jgi:DNA repair protein RadC
MLKRMVLLKKENASEYTVHSGHRARLKQSFKEGDASLLSDHKLLELLLFYSVSRRDTNETAHLLINEFGSLDAVFKASHNALLNVKGVGYQTALLIKIIDAINDKIHIDLASKENKPMTCEDMKRYLTAFYRSKIYETIVVLSCDNKRRIKKVSIVGEGAVNSTDINSRKIVEAVINANASYIVLAHNHPNGAPEPSLADVDATRSLVVMLRKLDVGVFDHIIIGADGDAFSMREHDRYRNLFI